MARIVLAAGFVVDCTETRQQVLQLIAPDPEPRVIQVTVDGQPVSIRPVAVQAVAANTEQVVPYLPPMPEAPPMTGIPPGEQ